VKNDVYFISDLHFGAPTPEASRARERKVVAFLRSIEARCGTLYIVGDLFDYWFEYKQVVPRGHVRVLAQLAAMVENGMSLHVFTGNHDLWIRDYLTEEIGAVIHYEPLEVVFGSKRFYVAHGDGLGPGDLKYKMLKRVFTHPLAQWAYNRLHPNFGVGFAARMSRASRNSQGEDDHAFLGENERQLIHSRTILADRWVDYFIYGHRHHVKNLELATKEENGTNFESRYVVLGDWITLDSYAHWDGTELTLNTFTYNA
jgi:UDP-2,3-diacylglucosamine hydrolase